jgi:putative flippase GtrA
LTWKGIGYLESGVLAVEAAILTNFLLDEFWVFRDYSMRSRGVHQRSKRFLRFNLVCATGAAINIGVLWLLTEFLGVYYMLSNLFGIAGATLWNYGVNANLTWGSIPAEEKARGKETVDDRELPKIGVGEPPTEQTIGWRLK